MILYTLVSGSLPFDGQNLKASKKEEGQSVGLHSESGQTLEVYFQLLCWTCSTFMMKKA